MQYKQYVRGEAGWLKSCFYVLRCLLAAKWIEQGRGIVPVPFAALVEQPVQNDSLRSSIASLLQRKITGNEGDHGNKDALVDAFIEAERAHWQTMPARNADHLHTGNEHLNSLFRHTLQVAWAG